MHFRESFSRGDTTFLSDFEGSLFALCQIFEDPCMPHLIDRGFERLSVALKCHASSLEHDVLRNDWLLLCICCSSFCVSCSSDSRNSCFLLLCFLLCCQSLSLQSNRLDPVRFLMISRYAHCNKVQWRFLKSILSLCLLADTLLVSVHY